MVCHLRLSENKNLESILFVHGYGCSKEFFDKAFMDPTLKDFNLIGFDLPGFGQSKINTRFSFCIADYARISIRLLDTLEISHFHLVCHSMGGLIGIEIAGQFPNRILTFSNLEGNLTVEDCFISGSIIKKSYQEFIKGGRKEFEDFLRRQAKKDPALNSYLLSFRLASSRALYCSAEHTVNNSKNSIALKRFLKLKNQCYIYGEKNRGLFPGEKKLLENGVPLFYIENAGHFMAEENPEQTYSVIADFIKNRSGQ